MKHDTTTVRVSKDTRRALKRYAMDNDCTMMEAMETAVSLLIGAEK